MSPEELFENVAQELLRDPRTSAAKMFGSQGLRVGGKVFASLVKGKLVVKLPQERVDALATSGRGERFDPGMGRLMKEWVAVGPGTPSEWSALAREARDFVAAGP